MGRDFPQSTEVHRVNDTVNLRWLIAFGVLDSENQIFGNVVVDFMLHLRHCLPVDATAFFLSVFVPNAVKSAIRYFREWIMVNKVLFNDKSSVFHISCCLLFPCELRCPARCLAEKAISRPFLDVLCASDIPGHLRSGPRHRISFQYLQSGWFLRPNPSVQVPQGISVPRWKSRLVLCS